MRTGYDCIRELREALRREALPANANLNVISRLKQVVSSGLPILIFKTPKPPVVGSSMLRAADFDYFGYILSLAVRSNQFTIKTIEETDHSFSNRAGRMAVRQHTETWLDEYF
jgi:hypothetical protein